MKTDWWGFEITIRALDITTTTNILTLPNGYDVVYYPKHGYFYINSHYVYHNCRRNDERTFVFAASHNVREGKLTIRVCQGDKIRYACSAKQIYSKGRNQGSLYLGSSSTGSM